MAAPAAAARSHGPYHRLMFRHINGKTAVLDELLRSLGSDWSTSSLRPLTHTQSRCVCVQAKRAERERIAGHNPSLLAVYARPAGTERVHGGEAIQWPVSEERLPLSRGHCPPFTPAPLRQ